MNINIALIGNPNSGKTTLYNCLTNKNEKVGNWTGVTVDFAKSSYKKNKNVTIIDLPGCYSLNGKSEDEKVVSDYLKNQKVDVIINVIDGTNLKRSLILTKFLRQINIPVVLALNMCDELQKNNVKIDAVNLSKIFDAPVVFISSKKRINIDKLITTSIKTIGKKQNTTVKNYNFDCLISKKNVIKNEKSTNGIDSFVLNRYLALPVLFCVLFFVYYISNKVGLVFSEYINSLIQSFNDYFSTHFSANVSTVWQSFISDGVILGIGSVLSFLPQILLISFFLSLLEQCGYASRISFVLDRLLSKIGLEGKSIIPFMLSCGCTVNGCMSCRIIEDENIKNKTMCLCGFLPCGAKMAVFSWLSCIFFNGSAFISVLMYFISVFSIAFFGRILNKFRKNDNDYFAFELPYYRFPDMIIVLKSVKDKMIDFFIKAGSTIFIISLILWFLRNFGFNGYTPDDIEFSFLYFLGKILQPLFYPLGFTSFEPSVSIVCGIFAREAVIECLTVLNCNFSECFASVFSIYAFMIFILLCPPCVASLSVMKKQLKSKKEFFKVVSFQFFCAYSLSLFVSFFGALLNMQRNLIFCDIAVIIFSIVIFIVFYKRKGLVNGYER